MINGKKELMDKMKALVLYGPNDYKIEKEWPMPELPEGWALVRVAYAGICGSDLPRFFTTGSYHAPMVIGHEFSGVVEKGAGTLPEGTPVAILPIIPCETCEGCLRTKQPFHCEHYQFIGSRNDGGFAEYCAVPEKNLLPLSNGTDLRTGAMIELLAVGLHVIRRSGCENGRCIVFGAGPIGLACALWLQYMDVDVTIVDVREFSLSIARKLNLKAIPFSELSQTAGFDYAYEASGSSEAMMRAIEVVRDLGSITVVGRNAKDTVFSKSVFERLMRKELTINGCWGYNLEGEYERMQDFLASHDLGCMISHQISLDEVPETLEQVKTGNLAYCKIMIEMMEGKK